MKKDKVCNYCIDSENVMACYSNPKDCEQYEMMAEELKQLEEKDHAQKILNHFKEQSHDR